MPQHAIQATCVYGLALVGGNIDSEADQEHAPAGKRKTSTGGSRSSWRDNRSLHEWVATSTDFPEARHGDTRSMMQRAAGTSGAARSRSHCRLSQSYEKGRTLNCIIRGYAAPLPGQATFRNGGGVFAVVPSDLWNARGGNDRVKS